MAIVAGSDGAVARLGPARVMCFHDMTVGAGGRVIRHVGVPFSVEESIDADAEGQADDEEEKGYCWAYAEEHS